MAEMNRRDVLCLAILQTLQARDPALVQEFLGNLKDLVEKIDSGLLNDFDQNTS